MAICPKIFKMPTRNVSNPDHIMPPDEGKTGTQFKRLGGGEEEGEKVSCICNSHLSIPTISQILFFS